MAFRYKGEPEDPTKMSSLKQVLYSFEGRKEENEKGQGEEPFNIMSMPRTSVGKLSVPSFRE